jgi:hypothetical protein
MSERRELRNPNGGPAWEPLLWFVGCLVLYLALGHAAFYKTDGPDIVRLLDAHLQTGAPLRHPWHVGFLPALDLFRRGLAGIGLTPGYVQLGDWWSALGAALGVACTRAGARRLGLDAGSGRLAAIALALCPATLLFATVVEFHGPLLGLVGLCFWWTTVQVVRPSWWGMVVLGVFCHAAFLIDGQGLFLPAWLLTFFVARRWRNGVQRRDLLLGAATAAVHLGLFVAMPRLLPEFYGFWANLGKGLSAEGAMGRPQTLDYTPAIFWQEWLWPLLPISVLVFFAPLRRALRLEFAAFLVGLLPFLFVSVRLLVFEPEYGAYMLPMALPAALLVAQVVNARWRMFAVASLLVGLLPWFGASRDHLKAQAAIDAEFATSVATAAKGKKPYVLVGSARELAAAYARLHPDELLWVRENATMPRQQATPEHFGGVGAYLLALHGAGRAVLLTEEALRSLDDPRAAILAEKPTLQADGNDMFAGPLFAVYLREHFTLEPAAPGMLRVLPKR